MTHTRAKLSRKQRDMFEGRFKSLGLDEGLKEKLIALKGTEAAAIIDPLVGLPVQFVKPEVPPGKVEPHFEPYARWQSPARLVTHNSLRCGRFDRAV